MLGITDTPIVNRIKHRSVTGLLIRDIACPLIISVDAFYPSVAEDEVAVMLDCEMRLLQN